MIREAIKTVKEKNGGKFHPIDVFLQRWVVTDGENIFGSNGEVKSIDQFKKDMKSMKKHDQYDYIYFPTEKMAMSFWKKEFDGDKNFQVQKLSYA